MSTPVAGSKSDKHIKTKLVDNVLVVTFDSPNVKVSFEKTQSLKTFKLFFNPFHAGKFPWD